MKYLLICLSLFTLPELKAQPTSHPIAIVELFTSQGCSSCPSADLLLREAVDKKHQNGEVYGLSFHVSYWNRLGWTDPYSSNQFTDRQKWYASKMKLGRIYTPQMVVDGQDEFVGSQKSLLEKSLKASFNDNKKSMVSISDVKKSENKLTVSYACENISGNELLNIALVQKEASNHVPRGENKNKTLVHANVVRAFTSTPAKTNGSVSISLPELSENADYDIIAYIQNKETLQITGTGKIHL